MICTFGINGDTASSFGICIGMGISIDGAREDLNGHSLWMEF